MVQIRLGGPDDVPAIYAALFRAANWDPSRERRSLEDPTLAPYHDGWGRRGGDLAVIAEDAGRPVGAAYCRLMHGYGYVDDDTPELTIGVESSYRGRGIGRELLDSLADLARLNGFERLSLSVEPDNPARRLYERAGYRQVGVDEDGGIVMLLDPDEADDDDRPPICPRCGVTMVLAALSAEDPRDGDWVCLECEELGEED
jgi:ribosomal protein S18 acetylase RimI-like enzyme